MSGVVPAGPPLPDRRDQPFGAWLFETLRSARAREIGYFALLGMLVAGVNLAWGVECPKDCARTSILLSGVAIPLLVGPFVFTGWLLADRATGAQQLRSLRLALGVLGGAAVAAVAAPLLAEAMGIPFFTLADEMVSSSGTKYTVSPTVMVLGLFMETALYTGLAVAALEMSRRRLGSEEAVLTARREQTQMTRELLESRLAAMQAQVEPQFLFDSLVDVERLYARNPAAAAAHLDHLIRYLRVALPRLRESGSTLAAELDLVEAYVAVVQALHHGTPILRVAVEPDAAAHVFHPMLLLPLVQRAVRRRAAVPARIEIAAHAHPNEVVVVLSMDACQLCEDDAELGRVRERLQGLYGERARLECAERAGRGTVFTLHVPT